MDTPFDVDVWWPLLRGSRAEQVAPELRALELAGERAYALWHAREPAFAPRAALAAMQVDRRRERQLRAARPAARGVGVERYHVLPNAGGAYVLLRSDHGCAFRAGLSLLPAGRARWRAATQVLRGVSRLGLRLLPGAGALTILSSRAGGERAPELDGEVAAVACGVPGHHQKLTLRLLETEDAPERIIKLSKGPASCEQVQREARVLDRLAQHPRLRALAPTLLGNGLVHGHAYLVQEALNGRRVADALAPAHVACLRTLADETSEARPAAALPRLEQDAQRLAQLAQVDRVRVFSRLLRAARGHFEGRHVPSAMAHGDFTPWNLIATANGVRAFDWEYAEPQAPALHDLFHFVLQTGVLVARHAALRLDADVRDALQGPGGPLQQALGVQPGDVDALLGLYLVHVAAFDAEQQAHELPGFEQVEWLRQARVQLAERVIERLSAQAASRGPERLAA